jgi:hypothetical protein
MRLTPNRWLAETIEAQQVSQAKLAKLVHVSPSQLNHWVKDTERIPRDRLLDIAYQLAPDQAIWVRRLKELEELTGCLGASCSELDRVLAESGDGYGGVFRRLDGCVSELVDAQIVASDEERAECAIQFTSDAIFVARAFTRAMQENDAGQFRSSETLRRHLRYPVNVLTGALVGGPPVGPHGDGSVTGARAWFLDQLRRGARTRTHRSPLCLLHDLHLLCRYGEAQDRALVHDVVFKGRHRDNPLARSIASTGNILSSGDQVRGEKFAHDLLREPAFADAALRFDAFHYGDLRCAPDELLTQPAPAFTHAAIHLARQLGSRHYAALSPVIAVKLAKILETPATLDGAPLPIRARMLDVFSSFAVAFRAAGGLGAVLGDDLVKQLDAAATRTLQEATWK